MSRVSERRREIASLNTDAIDKLKALGTPHSSTVAGEIASLHLGSIGEALWEIAEVLDDLRDIAKQAIVYYEL